MGEENLISNEKNKLKIPNNLGIIISNQEFNEINAYLLKLINWSIILGIKEMILYDPFNILSEKNLLHFNENLNKFFAKNPKDIYLFRNNVICYMNNNNNILGNFSQKEIKGIKDNYKDKSNL